MAPAPRTPGRSLLGPVRRDQGLSTPAENAMAAPSRSEFGPSTRINSNNSIWSQLTSNGTQRGRSHWESCRTGEPKLLGPSRLTLSVNRGHDVTSAESEFAVHRARRPKTNQHDWTPFS
jgi:hypothetical protein